MSKPPLIANLLAFETAPRVNLVSGEVVLLGPGATGFSMTPAATRELQDRLDAVLRDCPP